MLIDASIIIEILFNKANATWCVQCLNQTQTPPMMTVMDLTKVLATCQKTLTPQAFHKVKTHLKTFGIEFISPSVSEAHIAAEAALKFGLSWDASQTYAAAKYKELTLITLNPSFAGTDINVLTQKVAPPSQKVAQPQQTVSPYNYQSQRQQQQRVYRRNP